MSAPLTWRPLSPDDAAAIVRLDHATLVVDDRDDPLSLEEVQEEFDPSWARPDERSVAAVGRDGDLAGMAWIHLRPASTRARVTFLVHPDHRDGDVPRRLLTEVYERIRRMDAAGAVPDDATVEIGAQPHQAHRVELLESEGFTPVRRFHELRRDLAHPLPPAALPEAVTVARWNQRWSEATRLAHVEAFADHWGSAPPDEEAWQHDYVGGANFRADLSLVAHSGDDVVGYLLAHVWEQDWKVKGYREAWIGTLGTRRAWRGRGVASYLLLRCMHRMRTAGMEYAAIGVDSQSPTGADRLYAQLGFELQRVTVNYALPVTALR